MSNKHVHVGAASILHSVVIRVPLFIFFPFYSLFDGLIVYIYSYSFRYIIAFALRQYSHVCYVYMSVSVHCAHRCTAFYLSERQLASSVQRRPATNANKRKQHNSTVNGNETEKIRIKKKLSKIEISDNERDLRANCDTKKKTNEATTVIQIEWSMIEAVHVEQCMQSGLEWMKRSSVFFFFFWFARHFSCVFFAAFHRIVNGVRKEKIRDAKTAIYNYTKYRIQRYEWAPWGHEPKPRLEHVRCRLNAYRLRSPCKSARRPIILNLLSIWILLSPHAEWLMHLAVGASTSPFHIHTQHTWCESRDILCHFLLLLLFCVYCSMCSKGLIASVVHCCR